MPPSDPRAQGRPPALGLFGPGRTRNGLGPFLAQHLERAGARVVAVAGRTAERTAPAAAALAERLGHEVAVHDGIAGLVARGDLAGVVIATPIEAHLQALEAAAAARLPALCEKPLVDVGQHAAAMQAVRAFARGGVPLVENCQWPLALAALRARGALPDKPPRVFAMRLSPAGTGRTMLVDSVSHFLSLLQALYGTAVGVDLDGARFSSVAPDATELRLDLDVDAGGGRAQTRLHLARCPTQPRPAWLEFDGRRCERRLTLPAYHWSFTDGQSEHAVGDPQAELAYHFVELLTQPRPDLVRRHAAAIAARAELFAAVVRAFDRQAAG